jgi:hypothetical protein
MRDRLCATLLAACVVAGCSGVKTYPEGGTKNVSIRTDVSGVRASVHIHEVAPDCRGTRYVGTVALDARSTRVSIPADRWSYLVFVFSRSSMLRGSSGSVRAATLLKPHPGYGYEFQVSYRDDAYDVALREADPRKSTSRELARLPLGSCPP